jgi:hypothetical protein
MNERVFSITIAGTEIGTDRIDFGTTKRLAEK